ncbi:GtrA family protein [bacterium]|nr:GtrA family protein [bacterium]
MNVLSVYIFGRYLLVAMFGLTCDMTTLFLLVQYAKFPVLVATAIAFMVAVIVNFNLHKRWTFHDNAKNVKTQFTYFFIISTANFLLTMGFMYLFVDIVNLWYMFAKIITATLVLIFSYTMNRLLTFRHIRIRGKVI